MNCLHKDDMIEVTLYQSEEVMISYKFRRSFSCIEILHENNVGLTLSLQ